MDSKKWILRLHADVTVIFSLSFLEQHNGYFNTRLG